jgi:hypothetical protein
MSPKVRVPELRKILTINIHNLAEQAGVSYGSTGRVLKKHLHLHPHKITAQHELKAWDTASSVLSIEGGLQM